VLRVAVLTAAMAMRAAYAAPAAAVAQVKAIDCCVRHCDHRVHPSRPENCCPVLSQATDAALLGATPSVHRPELKLPLAVQQAPGSEVALSFVREHALDPPRGGAPLFLTIRSLRL
jgi:hypothetical protein